MKVLVILAIVVFVAGCGGGTARTVTVTAPASTVAAPTAVECSQLTRAANHASVATAVELVAAEHLLVVTGYESKAGELDARRGLRQLRRVYATCD